MFLARQLEDVVPNLAQQRFQSGGVLEECAGQALAMLLQLFGQFGEADFALVRAQAGAVGVLVPNKAQERAQQTRPHLALDPVGILAGKDIEPEHAFPLFENQFDLPAHAVQIACGLGRQFGYGSIGQEDEPAGQLQRLHGRLPAVGPAPST